MSRAVVIICSVIGVLFLLLVCVAVVGISAMSKTLVLCSTFQGQLVDANGQAVVGIPVERSWNWALTGETGVDKAVTDDEGRFSFPEVTGKNWKAGFLPHAPSIRQEVNAQGPGGNVLLFSVDKPTYDPDGELLNRKIKGPGINLVCRIDAKPNGDGPFWGTCEAAPGHAP